MIITIPSLVLFCDHFIAHIIKYKVKDMVKVEKISPQQAVTTTAFKCHSNDNYIKGKKQSTSSKLKVRSKALQVNDTL